MKFSAFALSAVIASASASKVSPSDFAATNISIVGLQKDLTAEDFEVVAASIKTAFNELFASPESQAIGFEAKSGAMIASEVSELTR